MRDKILLEAAITPTVMLGIVLFILIFFVVRIWLMQDDDRREERERRQVSDNPAFPFFDGDGSWVTNERRKHTDRRHTHAFIIKQSHQHD